VSNAVESGERVDALPETAIRNRSQYADTLHRQDPDADEPRPACPEADYRTECDFTDVPLAAYRPVYDLCENPECFGREWR
jgi:hypothetical protein